MKRIIIPILLLLVLFITYTSAFAGPKLKFINGTKHDFGESKQHEQLKNTFDFKNVGDDTLRIIYVKGG